jgi:hypothetical protein
MYRAFAPFFGTVRGDRRVTGCTLQTLEASPVNSLGKTLKASPLSSRNSRVKTLKASPLSSRNSRGKTLRASPLSSRNSRVKTLKASPFSSRGVRSTPGLLTSAEVSTPKGSPIPEYRLSHCHNGRPRWGRYHDALFHPGVLAALVPPATERRRLQRLDCGTGWVA